MRGAKSGCRKGTVSGVVSDVALLDDKSRIISELMVLGDDGSLAFARRGDSGAWAIDGQGDWVGVVVGGGYDVRPPRTYISGSGFYLDQMEKHIGERPKVPSVEGWKRLCGEEDWFGVGR